MAHDQRDNDVTTRRILDELQGDGRLSLAELGRRVGLSPPAVAERVQRLERDGVITGYHATVDPRALGYSLTTVIRIRPAPRQIPKEQYDDIFGPVFTEAVMGLNSRSRANRVRALGWKPMFHVEQWRNWPPSWSS